jgi:hypothetical protein
VGGELIGPRTLASDAERERAAVLLRDAAGEGRLTLEELSDRLAFVFAARTAGELEALTRDLPAPLQPPPSLARPTPVRRRIIAIMSGAKRRGRWRLEDRCTAVAVMGGCSLDLRHAEIGAPRAQINAVAVMGGIEIIVPEGVEVELTGIAVMGGKHARIANVPVRAGTPIVHVRVLAVMGGVAVKSAPTRRLGGDRPSPPRSLPQ